MNLQDWGAIGEVVGALAVVITLIYLAKQIGQNTHAMEEARKLALAQETQFDPLADTSPAASAPSNTIHAPGDDSRAAPAQLEAATPPAHSSPAETIADEPKPG